MSSLTSMFAALALLQAAPMTEAGREIRAQERARLADCLERVESDREAAYDEGLRWVEAGNRPLARYCTASALIALGHFREGAARLEALANAPDAGDLETRALYLARSGNAWMAAGLPDAARLTLTNALKLRPEEGGLYKDRAATFLAMELWDPALADLDRALELAPGDPEALELRARANLARGRLGQARADVETARELAPTNIDLLVLRGEIREAQRLE